MAMKLLLRTNLITKVHHLCNNDKSHSYSNRPVITNSFVCIETRHCQDDMNYSG